MYILAFALGYYHLIGYIRGSLQSEHSSFANLILSFVTVDFWEQNQIHC